MNINELFERCVDTSINVYKDCPADYEQMNMFVAHTPDDNLHVMACPWANEEEKLETLRAVRAFMREKNVDFYVMVGEAWAVAINPAKESLDQQPSQHPNKFEIGFVSACDKSGEVLHVSWRLHRHENGIILEQQETPVMSTGRMAELLK